MDPNLYKKEKFITYDLEVMPRLTLSYGKTWKPFEAHTLEPGYIFSISWKYLDKDKVYHKNLYDYTGPLELKQSQLIQDIWEIFNDADVLCGHNSDKFDNRVSQTAFVSAGLKPPSPFLSVDTLKIGRSVMDIPSFKLDNLAEQLGMPGKADESAVKLMIAVYKAQLKDDTKEIKKLCRRIKKYNNQDVVVTEDVYRRLAPYKKNLPAKYTNGYLCTSHACEGRLRRNGFQNNKPKTQAYQRWFCMDCGKHYNSVSAIKKDEYEKPLVKG